MTTLPKYLNDLPEFTCALRCVAFPIQSEAALYLNIHQDIITDYEIGEYNPPQTYIAALAHLAITQSDISVTLTDKNNLLQEINKATEHNGIGNPINKWADLTEIAENYLQTLGAPPKPPKIIPPPALGDFVGRQAELAYFSEKLLEHNLTVISGTPGVGKTTLAVAITRLWQTHITKKLTPENMPDVSLVFWHSFQAQEGLLEVAKKLAVFLYWHNQPRLWHIFESVRLLGAYLPPLTELLNYILQTLRGRDYLLCFDNVHFAEDDLFFNRFVEEMSHLIAESNISLLLISRQVPFYITTVDFERLKGLNQTDTKHLLKLNGLNLTTDEFDILYKYTLGSNQLLKLVIDTLKNSSNIKQDLINLINSDNVAHFLMQELDNQLTETERAVLIALAVLRGQPVTRAVIETVSEQRRIKKALLNLTDRYFLLLHQNDEGEESYQTWPIVQDFYYNNLSNKKAQAMHCLAAKYYEEEEINLIQAAYHYEQATHYQTAIELLTTHFWPLMNQGQVHALRKQLTRLRNYPLPEVQIIKVILALADIYRKAAELATAKEYYQQALNLLTSLAPSAAKQLLIAQACHGMAECVVLNDVTESLQWVEQGLTALETADQAEKITLLLLKSDLQIRQADYQKAQQIIEQTLPQIPPYQNWFRIRGLKQLGIIYRHLGDIEQAIQLTSQALTLAEHYHNYFEIVHILNVLAMARQEKGDIIAAISTYQQALTLAQDLGLIERQLLLEGNLAELYIKLGNYQKAEHYLLKQLKIAKERDMKFYIVGIKINLAQLCIRQAKFDRASDYLKDTLTIAPKVGLNDWIPEIHRYLTLIDLAKNKITTALQHANQAVQVAYKSKSPIQEGIGWRILGQVQLANNNLPAALEAFAKSSALLTDRDLYELAHTQLEWGRYLITTPQLEEGKQHLQTARDTFKKMGAKVDLATTEALLKTIE